MNKTKIKLEVALTDYINAKQIKDVISNIFERNDDLQDSLVFEVGIYQSKNVVITAIGKVKDNLTIKNIDGILSNIDALYSAEITTEFDLNLF